MTEKWYFVRATPEQIRTLEGRKVTVLRITIQKPRRLKGVGFPVSEMQSVGEVVNLPENFVEKNTNEKNLFMLVEKAGEAEPLKKPKKEEIDIHRERYAKECSKRVKEYIRNTRGELRTAQAELQSTSRKIVELTRRVEALRVKEFQLENGDPDLEKRFGIEFDKLCQLPHVVKVKVRPGIVSVFTDTIFLEYKEETYELGNYRIDIHNNGDLHIVNLRIKDLTDQVDTHHPHVFDEGESVCLGNMTEGVDRLIGSYEYALVAQLIIEFLHTVNRDSSYIDRLKRLWKTVKRSPEKDKKD